jgi:hypothetical protein
LIYFPHTSLKRILQEKDALDLLPSYLGDDRIDVQIEAAKLLCQDLGYLPLGELVARLLKRGQDWKIKKDTGYISRKWLIRSKFSQKSQV